MQMDNNSTCEEEDTIDEEANGRKERGYQQPWNPGTMGLKHGYFPQIASQSIWVMYINQ